VLSVKALVIGSTGQLARELLKSPPPSLAITSTSRSDVDLSNPDALGRIIRAQSPAIVINASAHTAVDRAESERDLAFAVNCEAVGAMAEACAAIAARLVHVSTDFVFDGTSSQPYEPDAPTHPINVYGESKAAGERRIAAVPTLRWQIIRTAWVYSSAGRNFVLTMLRLFRERDRVEVVSDQIGTPTSASSLAACVWRAATTSDSTGIFHFTDAGVASWFDFAVAIQEEARAIGLLDKVVEIVPISTAQFPTPARRPAFSVLDKAETWRRFGIQPVHWRIKLREVLREIAS
jgi:dTDP-4-dehydrorhamnose reductase